MGWDGEVIGAGTMSLNSIQDDVYDYDLAFLKPWKSKAKVSFVVEELGDQTKVTWTMESSMPFFLFFMVKMTENLVGMDFERGLVMLKAMAEKGEVSADTLNCGTVDYSGFSYIGIERSVAISEMPSKMQKDFEQLVQDIVISGKKGAKHWVCIYPKFDMKNMKATYIAAVSDEDLGDLDLGTSYVSGEIPSSMALEIKHNGAYEFLGNAWSMGMMYMRAKKMKGGGYPFEQYWNSPMEETPENLKTSIYFPLK